MRFQPATRHTARRPPSPPKRAWALFAVVVLLGTATGCSPQAATGSGTDTAPARTIDWDVSEGHELDRIDWDEVVGDEHDMQILTGGVDMRLALPGGEVVEDRFKRVRVRRDATHLLTIDAVIDRDLTLDETMELAQQLSDRFDAPLDNFESWHDEMTRRKQQGRTISVTANTNGALMSPRGPRPSFRTIRSPDDERPVRINLQFSWRPDGEEYPRIQGDPW